MNKENKSFLGPFIKTSVFMILFLLVLVLVKTVDVAKIGENNRIFMQKISKEFLCDFQICFECLDH